MDLSALILLSQGKALRRRLDVVANNMANLSTTGFKREVPLFKEQMAMEAGARDGDLKGASFVLDFGATHDTSLGGFQVTGNPLDIMIDGRGYFQVDDGTGEKAFTRDGHLIISAEGELSTASGYRILDENGQPIAVKAQDAASLSIARDGTVDSRSGPLGRIAVHYFDDEASVDPRGDGLFNATGGRMLEAAETKMIYGGLEGSNVQPIVETTQMIDIMRTYETSMRLSERINDMRQRAIEKLGKAG